MFITGTHLYLSSHKKVTSMTFSDYLDQNIQYLNKFLTSEGHSEEDFGVDWVKFANWAFNEDGKKLVTSLRQKVEKVVKYDLADSATFETFHKDGPFQIVTSEYALSEGVPDLEGYEGLLGKANKLLDIGGSLIFIDVLRETYWIPNPAKPEEVFPSVPVEPDWLKGALVRQGFRVEQIALNYCSEIPYDIFDAEGFFAVWATKVKQVAN